VKTILITGASSGIGRALAVRAARAGYSVYAVGRNMKALAALGAQVNEEGGTIRTDVTDVSEPANAPGLIGRMVAAYGQVDVLVNNAGAVAAGPIATQSDEDLRVQFGTHVIGPLALVREALPSLRATSGHVFMVGSGVARVPVGGLGAYPPSKAALRSATAILRRELVPLEIAVTYVDPGAVETAFMTRAGMPGAPSSMLVSPELVARKMLFAIATRPRVLNVVPLQTAAVAVAEILPGVTDAILTRNPSLIGSGPPIALDANGRWEKMALPASVPLPPPEPATLDDHDAPREDDELDDDVLVDGVADDRAELALDEDDSSDTEARVNDTVAPEPAAMPEPAIMPEPAVALEPDAAPEAAVASAAESDAIPTATLVAAAEPQTGRWTYEPPEADDAVLVDEHEEAQVAIDDEPAHATSSYDAALEPLRNRMQRANLTSTFVRDLLVADAVLDVGETAMRWAGMPNKHERALTSEVFFALAEWGFLAPRADGRYRVIKSADD
jgi:short-subunit dehydrogenase